MYSLDPMQPLQNQPVLIDRAYERLVAAIADGSLPPGRRIRQEEVAGMLGISRQPVSHALQLLKRQRLVEDNGRRGLTVSSIDANRVLQLYQVRTVLEGLAARLAATRVASGEASLAEQQSARSVVDGFDHLAVDAPVAAFIDADMAFHAAIHQLSGNPAIAETLASHVPLLMRSMGVALGDSHGRERTRREHSGILEEILAGRPEEAELMAREHTDRSGTETVHRLAALEGQ